MGQADQARWGPAQPPFVLERMPPYSKAMFEDARSLNGSTTAVHARPPRIGSGDGWE